MTEEGTKLHELLKKRERIDLFAIILMAVFAFTVLYQIQYFQSNNLELQAIGNFAVAMGVFAAISLVMVLLLTNVEKKSGEKYMEIENFTDRSGRYKIKEFIKNDEIDNVQDDYTQWLFLGLGLQVGFQFFYTTFYAASIIGDFSAARWSDINYAIFVINAAIGEELFFSLFLGGLTLTFCKEGWHIALAGMFNITAFILFHTVVYGSNPTATIYILFLRGIYFIVYLQTRRVAIPILLHMLNNFIFVQTILFISLMSGIGEMIFIF